MKIVIIVIIAAVALFVVFKFFLNTTGDLAKDGSRPSDDKLPTNLKDNDKIIVIQHAKAEDLKKALTAFCNMYNKDDFAAIPRLYHITNDTFAVTFPFDTDFQTFCFAVNFLKYPIDIQWDGEVLGWTTIQKGDAWIPAESINKRAMVYLQKNDKEYDNVFLTTDDNLGYKLEFAGNKAKALIQPEEPYKVQSISANQLKDLAYEDFK